MYNVNKIRKMPNKIHTGNINLLKAIPPTISRLHYNILVM